MNPEQAKTFISKLEKERLQEIRSSPHQNARVLVKRLLGDPAHLIPEMLQNAEDAGATILRFDLARDRIIIQNNGEKFNEDQVDKLCTIGLSTKKSLGYIGMYGIGFKSVFAVSRIPEIYTGNYSFCFDDENVFVPKWIPAKEEFSKWNTTVVLPLKDEQAYNSLYQHISCLEKDNSKSMVFLKNLKEIRIRKDKTEDIFEKSEKVFPPLSELGNQFKFIEIKKNGITVMVFCVYTQKEKISSDLLKHVIQERRLIGIDESAAYDTRVNISFEIKDTGHIDSSRQGLLYAFLPTKVKTFLAFDINADFLLNPNREALNRIDDKYNCWLIDLVVKAVENIMSTYKENASKDFWIDIYDLLPRQEEARETWIEDKICDPIKEFIKEGVFFLTTLPEKPWVSRTDIVEASSEIKELFPLFSEIESKLEASEHYYLSEKIKSELRDFLVKEFDLTRVDTDYLFEVFSKSDILSSRPDDWYFLLFAYLGERYFELYWQTGQDFLNKSRNCYLIPCSNGKIVKLDEDKVYSSARTLPKFIAKKVLELRQGLYTKLTTDIKEDEDLQKKQEFAKHFLFALIHEATPKRIYDDLIFYEFANLNDQEIDEEYCKLLDNYILYLKNSNVKAEGIKLRISGRRIYKTVSSLYLANDYLKDENGQLLYDIEKLVSECEDVLFVTPDYLNLDESQDVGKKKEWREFLIWLDAKEYPEIEEKILFTATSKKDFLDKFKNEIGPVTFQVKGTGEPYTGIYYPNMKYSAYKLKNFFFKHSFALILHRKLRAKDVNFFVEFLKMIDFNWRKIKPWLKYCYLYAYVSTGYGAKQEVGKDTTPDFSSLGRWLQEKEWLPARAWPTEEVKLAKSSEVYLLMVDTAGINDALYIELDMVKSQELRRILKLKTAKMEGLVIVPEEDLDSLLELYKKWQNKGVVLNKENEKSLGKLYRLLNENIEMDTKSGGANTWTKFKEIVKMIYDVSGNWTRLSNVHYYSFDNTILEKLNEDIKREVLLIPYNITPANIKFLLSKLGLRDLFLESFRVVPDEVAYKREDSDYFIDLANALLSFFGRIPQEMEVEEKCRKIANIYSNHAGYLTYALKRDKKIISEWIRTDGILMNGVFWFTGELRDLGVEVAKELCIEFKFDKETKDFIEKIFARSEKYVKKVLEASGREYNILFEKTEKTGLSSEEGQEVIEEPPGEVSIRPGWVRGEELEKLYIKKIIECEEKEDRKAIDVSQEKLGYDIESTGAEDVRYIEVKGISAIELTDKEYKMAKEIANNYWLYIVIKREPFACQRIQNPIENCKFEKIYVDFRWAVRDWEDRGEMLTDLR